MGTCYKCGSEVTLKEEETYCDKCGALLRYWCNNCAEPFDIANESTNEKLKLCKICGYFYCPSCGICHINCQKFEWRLQIGNIIESNKTNHEKVEEIINYIEEIKTTKEQRDCPDGVPISYAKGRIKSLLARMEGYRVKGEYDKEAFKKWLKQILDQELGFEITVDTIRQNGIYGQEYRDAFNLAICYGAIKVEWNKNIHNKDYAVYKRIDGHPCKYHDGKDVLVKKCKECNNIFPKEQEYCNICPPYKQGSKKGQLRKLYIKLSNIDTCQLYRGEFKKHDKSEV